jgi:Uma2 family endonuclease
MTSGEDHAMSTATSRQGAGTQPTVEPPEGDQRVVLRGIGWEGYKTMLRLRGERPVPRMIYLDGDLILMSPAYLHESVKERFGWFVHVIVEELRIDCAPAGQTTFRRRAKRGGVEGDQTYYLASEPRIRGKTKIQLRTDPPPDLAIEVVNTHDADAAIEVYRRFGVPEVWVWEEGDLRVLVRQADGRYAEAPSSAAFPFLDRAEIAAWINRPRDTSETQWARELREWVRAVIVPRRDRQAHPEP